MKKVLEYINPETEELERLKQRCSQLEESQRKWEEKFNKIFCTSANPMALTSVVDGKIIDINDAYAEVTGYKREELIGHTTIEYGIWANPQQRNEILHKLLEEGKVANLEVGVRTKSGRIRTVLFSIDRIALNGSLYLLSIATDITTLKDAERELKRSEEKYRTLVDKTLQGLGIIQDDHFVFCNRRFAEITGYSINELLAFTPEEIKAIIHKDDHEIINGRRRDRMMKIPVPPIIEFRILRKDGTVVWLEIYSSMIEYDGKPAIHAAFMDITQKKRAVEELQKALRWQKAIFEGSRDAVIISDKNSRFIDANARACELTGYSKDELLTMGAKDLNNSIDDSTLDLLREQIMNGEEVFGESPIYTKDGRKIDAEFGHRGVNISGEFYIHSILRDITSRKRLEAQFMQAQKMEAIGVLAGGVAHDFNNLLTVIKGYTELALEDRESDELRRRDLEQIENAANRAESLASQLLAFSRKQILRPTILNLNNVLEETHKMLRRLIGENIEIAFAEQSDLWLVNVDPGQIQQIIMNLAVNARDAMPQGGKLTIETENVELDEEYIRTHSAAKAGEYVMMAISDNGIGMDAATQARIFEPFFTTKVEGKGTGLGLSTVYGIVKQSDGFIWVYSEPQNGTTFKIYLPRAEGEIIPFESEISLEPGFQGSETILVVEDETPVRALACRILRDRGYTLLAASNGKDALDVAREYTGEIHLIVTDIIMPGMSGKDLALQLKISRPGIKALYISGYTDSAIVHHGVLRSDLAFLQKPFTINGLAHKVREVISA